MSSVYGWADETHPVDVPQPASFAHAMHVLRQVPRQLCSMFVHFCMHPWSMHVFMQFVLVRPHIEPHAVAWG